MVSRIFVINATGNSFGEGGIRTPGTLLRCDGLANRYLRPLGHLSNVKTLMDYAQPMKVGQRSEDEGFEPPGLLTQRFSRPPLSTTQTILRGQPNAMVIYVK